MSLTLEEAENEYPNCIKMDGFDDCIVGVCESFGNEPRIVYDIDLIIQKLMKEGMSYDDAVEFYEYNQAGAYVGKNTPVFVESIVASDIKKRKIKLKHRMQMLEF